MNPGGDEDDDEGLLVIRVSQSEATVINLDDEDTGVTPSTSRKRTADDCIVLSDDDDDDLQRRQPETDVKTTPLVREVFKSYFSQMQMRLSSHSETPCGVCAGCLTRDCGLCNACASMVKFGGNGEGKVTCYKKKCVTSLVDDDVEVTDEVAGFKVDKSQYRRVAFDDRLTGDSSRTFYGRVRVEGDDFKVGDFVTIEPRVDGTALYVAQLLSLFEEDDGSGLLENVAHVRYFCRGADTAMGEAADEREIFALFEGCEDVLVTDFVKKVSVQYVPVPHNWQDVGGTEQALQFGGPGPDMDFWFKMLYQPKSAVFEQIKSYSLDFQEVLLTSPIGSCKLCKAAEDKATSAIPKLLSRHSFQLRGQTYSVGDAVFLRPGSFELPTNSVATGTTTKNMKAQKSVDEIVLTEYFRHANTIIKGSHNQTPDPLQVGLLEGLMMRDRMTLKVRKIFRPENTHLGVELSAEYDENCLFWSEEFEEVACENVEGKCFLLPKKLLPSLSPREWSNAGYHRFYLSKTYVRGSIIFPELCPEVIQRFSNSSRYPVDGGAFRDAPHRPLKVLDIFAGCGGLSLGLEQSGVAKSRWAIEKSSFAAKSYRRNHPESTVMVEDCNDVLQRAMNGQRHTASGKRIPKKGEVEMVVGGPPCQGFSGLNCFKDGDQALMKNAMTTTCLGFCDFYRPKYFILENVKSIADHGKGLSVQLMLRSLITMGYAVSMGVLEAGSFGVPQARRRFFLLAAAPHLDLPELPEPTHIFAQTSLSITLENKTFRPNRRWTSSAPYRTVTIRDALSDLPPIENGASLKIQPYAYGPTGSFQKMVRDDKGEVCRNLSWHICRDLRPIHVARISHVPLAPGSDWRDLPNREVTLSDGSVAKKLKYFTNKPKKGVCGNCARGKKGDCKVQNDTLIPWSLPHTAKKNNQWAGVFGRLEWGGYFPTTITYPDPLGKQGRVVHPEETRIMSVREYARSQGFPDAYKLVGNILELHRQIGNAVAPPVARAIGLEIRRCIKDDNLRG